MRNAVDECETYVVLQDLKQEQKRTTSHRTRLEYDTFN